MKDNNKGENMLTDGITDQIEANHEQQRRMRRVLEIAEYRADNYNAEVRRMRRVLEIAENGNTTTQGGQER